MYLTFTAYIKAQLFKKYPHGKLLKKRKEQIHNSINSNEAHKMPIYVKIVVILLKTRNDTICTNMYIFVSHSVT